MLARRNVRMGRGDRKGAVCLASWFAAVEAASLACQMHQVSEAWNEFEKLVAGLGVVLFWASFAYTTHLAIEPYFRRRWPRLLVSWSRVLRWRFDDPRIGRDLLVGCLAGTLLAILALATSALALNLPGVEPCSPFALALSLRGFAGAVGQATEALGRGPIYALVLSVLLVVGRALLRRDWLVWVVIGIVVTPFSMGGYGGYPMMDVLNAAMFTAVALLLIFRYGIFLYAVSSSICMLISFCRETHSSPPV